MMMLARGRSLARSRPLFTRRPFPQPTVILTSLLKEQDFVRHDSVESRVTLEFTTGPPAHRKEGMVRNRTAADM
jgi:hypothetical protein